MLDAGEELIPGFRNSRALHVWAGARPLLKDTRVAADDTRHMSRGMSVVRHDIKGMITVAGGKLTTYRLMASRVVDAVCEELGENLVCRTADEAVASGDNYKVTHRLEMVEKAKKEVDVQTTFVGFVDNDRVVLFQITVVLGFRQQDAVGHQLDQCAVRTLVFEAHLIAD